MTTHRSLAKLACLLIAPALLALSACAAASPLDAQAVAPAARPRFDAIAFFSGRTEGRGKLDTILSGTVDTLVEGRGSVRNGTLRLVQTVHEGVKPVKLRTWTIAEVAPGRYAGTLSDAEGAVTGETNGNRLHLAFVMEGGLPTEQDLTLSADGQRATNVMTVRKLGVTVAVLTEEIRRVR